MVDAINRHGLDLRQIQPDEIPSRLMSLLPAGAAHRRRGDERRHAGGDDARRDAHRRLRSHDPVSESFA
ncbi:MAG TPA: hypothetical protein VN615_09870 [Gaiellales bacterium]|nr:hypothetical protein [Gaiellales bacterium]